MGPRGGVLLDRVYSNHVSVASDGGIPLNTGERDVVLAFCHNGTVTAPFMQSCFEAISYDSQHGKRLLTLTMGQSPYIPDARSSICERFLKESGDWLWFLDTDMGFPPNALARLLAVADPVERAIVSGYYLVRYDGGEIHSTWLTVVPETNALHPIHDVPESGLVKVASVGMGCTIIHRNVLEAVAADNSDDSWRFFGHDLVENDGRNVRLGEDVTFCLRAKRVGFSTYGLTDLRLDHFKSQPLTRE